MAYQWSWTRYQSRQPSPPHSAVDHDHGRDSTWNMSIKSSAKTPMQRPGSPWPVESCLLHSQYGMGSCLSFAPVVTLSLHLHMQGQALKWKCIALPNLPPTPVFVTLTRLLFPEHGAADGSIIGMQPARIRSRCKVLVRQWGFWSEPICPGACRPTEWRAWRQGCVERCCCHASCTTAFACGAVNSCLLMPFPNAPATNTAAAAADAAVAAESCGFLLFDVAGTSLQGVTSRPERAPAITATRRQACARLQCKPKPVHVVCGQEINAVPCCHRGSAQQVLHCWLHPAGHPLQPELRKWWRLHWWCWQTWRLLWE